MDNEEWRDALSSAGASSDQVRARLRDDPEAQEQMEEIFRCARSLGHWFARAGAEQTSGVGFIIGMTLSGALDGYQQEGKP